jgi:hypothetical protein
MRMRNLQGQSNCDQPALTLLLRQYRLLPAGCDAVSRRVEPVAAPEALSGRPCPVGAADKKESPGTAAIRAGAIVVALDAW